MHSGFNIARTNEGNKEINYNNIQYNTNNIQDKNIIYRFMYYIVSVLMYLVVEALFN